MVAVTEMTNWAVDLIDVMHGENARMIERRRGTGFSLEPAELLRIAGGLRGKELECHFTAELGVLGEPDFPHPAAADRRNHPEPAERLPQGAFLPRPFGREPTHGRWNRSAAA